MRAESVVNVDAAAANQRIIDKELWDADSSQLCWKRFVLIAGAAIDAWTGRRFGT
jgi:hypothetical protein